MVSLYKGRGDKRGCKEYVGIAYCSCKVHDRILINRVRKIADAGEEKGGFRAGRGHVTKCLPG